MIKQMMGLVFIQSIAVSFHLIFGGIYHPENQPKTPAGAQSVIVVQLGGKEIFLSYLETINGQI